MATVQNADELREYRRILPHQLTFVIKLISVVVKLISAKCKESADQASFLCPAGDWKR